MTENIKVITHSCIRLENAVGIIYFDPYEVPGKPHDADYILVTHDHYDHFSPEDIAKLAKPDTVMIVPEKMADKAAGMKGTVGCIETVAPGEHRTIDRLELETVPAYNNIKPFHPKKNGWVGYILILDGKRIYVAGDTDMTKENKAVQCDIALVPIGGTYTMDAKKAAELINTIGPEVAIPTHYGNIVGKAADAEVFASLVKPPVKTEIKLKL